MIPRKATKAYHALRSPPFPCLPRGRILNIFARLPYKCAALHTHCQQRENNLAIDAYPAQSAAVPCRSVRFQNVGQNFPPAKAAGNLLRRRMLRQSDPRGNMRVPQKVHTPASKGPTRNSTSVGRNRPPSGYPVPATLPCAVRRGCWRIRPSWQHRQALQESNCLHNVAKTTRFELRPLACIINGIATRVVGATCPTTRAEKACSNVEPHIHLGGENS